MIGRGLTTLVAYLCVIALWGFIIYQYIELVHRTTGH